MSITFKDLQAKVTAWSHRTDLAAQIPDFCNIGLQELELNYNFRGMLKKAPALAVTANSAWVTPPTDYKELAPSWFVDATGKRWPLTKDSERHSVGLYPDYVNDADTIPQTIAYAQNSAGAWMFLLRPTPNVAGTIDLSYYAKSPDLVADGDTNYILNGDWSLLLFAALVSLSEYIDDAAGFTKWSGHREALAQKIIASETKEKFAGSYQSVKSGYVIE